MLMWFLVKLRLRKLVPMAHHPEDVITNQKNLLLVLVQKVGIYFGVSR